MRALQDKSRPIPCQVGRQKYDRPFVIIGERIKSYGRKVLAAEMAAGIRPRQADARAAQVEAGRAIWM